MTDSGPLEDFDLHAEVYINPATACTLMTVGDSTSIWNLNSGGSVLAGPVYRTVTPNVASYAAKSLWTQLLSGETQMLGPYWYDATATTDSTMFTLITILSDSCEVFWRMRAELHIRE